MYSMQGNFRTIPGTNKRPVTTRRQRSGTPIRALTSLMRRTSRFEAATISKRLTAGSVCAAAVLYVAHVIPMYVYAQRQSAHAVQ